MIVRYVDDRMRSRVTGMRLAIGFGVSSLVVAAHRPVGEGRGLPVLLMALAVVACLHHDRHLVSAQRTTRRAWRRSSPRSKTSPPRVVRRQRCDPACNQRGWDMLKRRSCAGGNRRLDHRRRIGGPRAGLAEPAGQDRGALHSGRRHRHRGPRRRREDRRAARPAGDRREQGRRQHHHRHGGGGQVQARRPHAAARHDDARDQRRARPQAAVRSAEGFPADLDDRRHPRHDRDQQGSCRSRTTPSSPTG